MPSCGMTCNAIQPERNCIRSGGLRIGNVEGDAPTDGLHEAVIDLKERQELVQSLGVGSILIDMQSIARTTQTRRRVDVHRIMVRSPPQQLCNRIDESCLLERRCTERRI